MGPQKLKEELNSITMDYNTNIEEKLKVIQENDALVTIIDILSNYYPDIKLVWFTITNIAQGYVNSSKEWTTITGRWRDFYLQKTG